MTTTLTPSTLLEQQFADRSYPTGWPRAANVAAVSPALRDAVFAFRKRAVKDRQIEVPSTSIRDSFDDDARCLSFLLFEGDQPVGTVRGVIRRTADSPLTPSYLWFKAQIGAHLDRESWVDVGRLMTLRGTLAAGMRRTLGLLQNISALADTEECRYILAPVREYHIHFYSRIGFTVLAQPRSVAGFPQPLALMVLDWPSRREYLRSHKMYRYVFSERNSLSDGVSYSLLSPGNRLT